MSFSSHRLSRRHVLTLLGSGLGVATLACLGYDDSTEPSATVEPDATATVARTSEPQPSAQPAASLEAMIGQMLMLGFRGGTLERSEPVHTEIGAGRVGNVVLFDYDIPSNGVSTRNVQSPSQLKALTNQVQSLSSVPQLIATDQEGGRVARLKPAHGFPDTLAAEEVGGWKDLARSRDYARAMATVLAEAGVNLNLAPVVDVNVNPANPIIGDIGRSFSSDPEEVANQARVFIEAHHEKGVLCTLKHFPGHGSSVADSHLGFVDVTNTWTEAELIPFQRTIQAGLADAVMTAHIFNAKLDPTYPATLSKPTITGLLRERLGYDGVVITDDMLMGAIANYYTYEQGVEAAILAGADIVAISQNQGSYQPESGNKAFATILAAVHAGRIPEVRIRESYERIMRLKARLG
jgi:beta-N-acetylhexosaminidase